MEILPGIHHLKQDMAPAFPGCWTSVNIVVSQRLAVVDTGMPGAAEQLILPYLSKLRWSPRRLAAIAVTHAHADHFGGNEQLKGVSRAPIAAHTLDGPVLEHTITWLGHEIRPGPVDLWLRDGDVIDLGTRRLEAVHLPGHTPGSCGYYLREEGVLICGDSLQGLGTAFQHLPFYTDPDAYVGTVQKALAMRVEHLVLAHAYRPFGDSHLHGADVQRFLEASLECALGLDAHVEAALRDGAQPATAAALAARVCERLGAGGATDFATATVTAHLRRMVARGQVQASSDGPDATYRLR